MTMSSKHKPLALTFLRVHIQRIPQVKFTFVIRYIASNAFPSQYEKVRLREEGFLWGVHPIYELFRFLTSFLKIQKRVFASVIKRISGHFIFQISGSRYFFKNNGHGKQVKHFART